MTLMYILSVQPERRPRNNITSKQKSTGNNIAVNQHYIPYKIKVYER